MDGALKLVVWMRGRPATGCLRPLPLAFLSIPFVTGCTGQAASPDIALEAPRSVIVDVDMAHEDMHAALFLLQHPNVDVEAITVAGTGEAHCGPGTANALGLVRLSREEGIPVACGSETTLEGDHAFPVAWRGSADSLYGLGLPEGGEPSALSASQLMADVLMDASDRVSIVAVGPLTNVAEALQNRPEIKGKIDAVYVMGGAITVDGNVGGSGVGIDNSYAEWNIYVDPVAANIVFESGLPITLVPLDATRDVPVTRRFYDSLGQEATSPAAKFVHETLGANLDFVDSGGFEFWDSLTAAIFADESLAEFEEYDLQVVEAEGAECGYTKPAEGGAAVRVAVGADRRRFERLFVTALNWQD